MTIGIAVIGSGIFIQEAHLPGIKANGDLFSLNAIYSRSLASAQKLSKEVESTTPDLYAEDAGSDKSYAKLLERSDVEAVVIALPILAQPEFIKKALSAGKHVLSEKPVAKDLATAHELIDWYHTNIDTKKTIWAVAENFRYLGRFQYGAEQVKELGDILGFRLRMHAFVKPGAKYYETEWRKTPEYQGGFLLDGGVHFIAAMRQLLGQEAKMSQVAAFTAQLQPHLPPIDTINATVKLANGTSGTFSVSFGTTFSGAEYIVACQNGTVDVGFDKTIVKKDGNESTKDFTEDKNGVRQELKAWGESIAQGKAHPLQTPEEALADLEVLEAMIKSGEADGKAIELKLQ
ncbi:NAD(P)-binding protein [Aureobasidium pullulans EXF-150]|uniref:NAD(P)-binding protein n=2 Tax=Aureobasidium pullulans TaxID=5580 RepID=A0A074XQL8_AURPU|nr:NAD(P)-binding protein [Aureobasidium pullulans EXF-150]KEQ84242.1 NAD(P)-binding protein [Aureobasidium pullulans EXF-150]